MEEKEIDKKPIPGTLMSFMLFLFLYGNIRLFLPGLYQMGEAIFDAQAMGDPLTAPLIESRFKTNYLEHIIWPVIKMLRMDNDALHSLRWAIGFDLMLILCCIVIKLPELFMYSLWSRIGVFGFALFNLFLLRYLCKSKSIRTLFPKENRRKTPALWIWLSYILITLTAIGINLSEPFHKLSISEPIDLSELQLAHGAHSDGRIQFVADTLWHQSDSLFKFPHLEDDWQDFVRFHAKDSEKEQFLFSGLYTEDSPNEYILLLLQIQPYADSLLAGEIAWGDTLIKEDHYRYSQYLYHTSEGEKLWTTAIRYDHQSFRCCLYSVLETSLQTDSIRSTSLNFVKAIQFCSIESTKSEVHNHADNNQQQISRERIPDKEYTILASIPESLLPSKSLGVMRTESQECRQGNHKQSKFFDQP